jgi:hypothetical protein
MMRSALRYLRYTLLLRSATDQDLHFNIDINFNFKSIPQSN